MGGAASPAYFHARLLRPLPTEDPSRTIARRGAAALALAAGVVHLAQVQVHADEDWRFGLFFVVVGALQLLGSAYLVLPVGPPRVARAVAWFGIVGSLATIGFWALSRTLGLPFGAEPGPPEQVGLADAAADLFELFTALLLLMWLRADRQERLGGFWPFAGAALALILGVLWYVARALGLFDPDPRLVALPQLSDAAALAFLVLVAALFVLLRLTVQGAAAAVLLVGVFASALALWAFTVPARGGQNIGCRYGPLADDSGLRHSKPPDPVDLREGEERGVVVLQLVACGREAVEIRDVSVLHQQGDAVHVAGFRIDRARTAVAARVAPAGTGIRAVGVIVEPGRGRYPLVVQVTAEREGVTYLNAVRIDYRSASGDSHLPFATFATFCVPRCQDAP